MTTAGFLSVKLRKPGKAIELICGPGWDARWVCPEQAKFDTAAKTWKMEKARDWLFYVNTFQGHLEVMVHN